MHEHDYITLFKKAKLQTQNKDQQLPEVVYNKKLKRKHSTFLDVLELFCMTLKPQIQDIMHFEYLVRYSSKNEFQYKLWNLLNSNL